MPKIKSRETILDGKTIVMRIRHALLEQDMTQRELAPLLGVAPNTLSSRMQRPDRLTLAELRRLCKVLHIEPGCLLGLDQDISKQEAR